MLQNNQQVLIDDYEMIPFEVLVLNPKRTLCEKIMSLIRFSQTMEPINDLRNKIRHTYDIHLMLKDQDLNNFFNSDEFEPMLLRVGNDDVESFKNNNRWLSNHPSNSIIFSETENTWNKIKSVYESSFGELVFGELPDETEIVNTLMEISNKLKSVKWDIKL